MTNLIKNNSFINDEVNIDNKSLESIEDNIDNKSLESIEDNVDNKSLESSKYICYLLKSEICNRTYIGITNNIKKRIRQHNGEICGGAKYTKSNRPWKVVLTVSGFTSKNQVLSFEYRVKKKKNNKNKLVTVFLLNNRIKNFFDVLQLDNFTSKCINPKENKYRLIFFDKKIYKNIISNLNINCKEFKNIFINYNEFTN